MAARRTEELLRVALGVPDRIPYADKRAVRAALPGAAERAAELAELHRRAAGGSPAGPSRWSGCRSRRSTTRRCSGSTGCRPAAGVVSELVDGGVVAGRLVAAAGPDLHLRTAGGRGRRARYAADDRVGAGRRGLGGGGDGARCRTPRRPRLRAGRALLTGADPMVKSWIPFGSLTAMRVDTRLTGTGRWTS